MGLPSKAVIHRVQLTPICTILNEAGDPIQDIPMNPVVFYVHGNVEFKDVIDELEDKANDFFKQASKEG